MSALEEEIRRGESDVLEFKRELPVRERQFLKTVVAFANGKGGKILFGVDNATHEVLGVEAESRWEMQDRITDMISNSCSPQIYPNCDWVEVGGKPLLLLSVPAASNCPYYIRKEGVQKGTYVRVGATTRRAELEKIRELEMYGEQVTYDSIIPRGVAPVTSDEVNYLCKLLGEMQKEGGKKPSITQLVNWGFVRGEGEEQYLPTNAFLLLVGRHFPFAGVQCARFKGNTQVEFIDRKMLEGSLYEQYRNTLIFLRFHLKRSTIIRGALREDQDELPVAALREAVANAIVHRNYLVHGMIKVSVFDDRVEISSPGTLYANLSEDEMMQGVSRLRNPLLAECFHKLGVIERWGGGVRRIYDLCRAEEIPDPVYHIGDDSITVVFRRPGSDGIEREPPHQGKNSSSGEKLRDSIVRLIRENPHATRTAMATSLHVSPSNVQYHLDRLRKAGIISRRGDKRSGMWVVSSTGTKF